MDSDFAEYLQAKFPLDERSLNPRVRELLTHALKGRPKLRCLDLGTGTGAMLRRLIEWNLSDRLMLTGLDAQPELLELAREATARLLGDRGFVAKRDQSPWTFEGSGRTVELSLRPAKLADFRPGQAGCDLITAQAFMDLVPLADALGLVKSWLKPGGLFYATLNYDGGTHFFPRYGDEAFEERLLENYDRSMERRRVDGRPTGGCHSGTRLHGALETAGFELLGYGTSDWNLTPESGAYRDQDAICLQTILECIREEGLEAGGFEGTELEAWFLERKERTGSGHLGLIVHQLDVLARRG